MRLGFWGIGFWGIFYEQGTARNNVGTGSDS